MEIWREMKITSSITEWESKGEREDEHLPNRSFLSKEGKGPQTGRLGG